MIIGALIGVDPQQWLPVLFPSDLMKSEQTVGGRNGKTEEEERESESEKNSTRHDPPCRQRG